MSESTNKTQLLFGVSHRACRVEGLCDEADCRAIHEVIEDLQKRYAKVADIDYIDWEFKPLINQSEEALIEKGRHADGIIFIIEKELGKRQLDGYRDCIKRRSEGKPTPRMFFYLKRDISLSKDEFKAFQDKIHSDIKERTFPFYDPDGLAKRFEKNLNENNWIDKRIKEKRGRVFPKWLVWALTATVIAIVLFIFGPRKPSEDPGSKSGVDTTTIVVHGDSVSTPNPPERIFDHGGTGHHYNPPKENNSPIITKPAVALDAFRVEANQLGFAASLSDGIKGSVPFISEKEDNPRWIITVTEDDTAEEIFVKTAPNDWDKVKIRFVVSIVDATGTLSTKKTIVETVGKSPSGIEAARTKARDTAVPQIIDVISDYIR